jgi:branched-subunit amino acid ABC-type transport system permease component
LKFAVRCIFAPQSTSFIASPVHFAEFSISQACTCVGHLSLYTSQPLSSTSNTIAYDLAVSKHVPALFDAVLLTATQIVRQHNKHDTHVSKVPLSLLLHFNASLAVVLMISWAFDETCTGIEHVHQSASPNHV